MKRWLALLALAGCSVPDGRQLVVHVRAVLPGEVGVDLEVDGAQRGGFVLTREADDGGELGSFGVVPSDDASEVVLRFSADGFVHEARFADFAPSERTFVFVCLDPDTACADAASCPTLPAHGAPDAAWVDCLANDDVPPDPSDDDGRPDTIRRVTSIGGVGDQRATDVVRLAGGTDVVAGRFFGTIDLDGPHSADGEDGFVRALDADGATTWWLWLAGPNDDAVTALAAGADGTTIVTGTFTDRVDVVGPGGVLGSLISRGGRDAFVLIVDATGALSSSRGFGSPFDDVAADVSAGTERDQVRVAIAGGRRGTLDLESTCPWNGSTHAGIAAEHDAAFVAVFDAALTCLRGVTIVGGAAVAADAVAFEEDGQVHVAARHVGSVELPPSLTDRRPPVEAPVDGAADAFLFTFDPDRRVSALVPIGGPGEDRVDVLELAPFSGSLLVAGTFGVGVRHFGIADRIGAPDRRIFAAQISTATMMPTWVKDTAASVTIAPTAGASSASFDGTIVASFTGSVVVDDTTIEAPVGGDGVLALRFDARGALVQTDLLVAGQATAAAYCDDASGATIAGTYTGTVDVEGLGLANGVDGFVIRR